MLGISAHLIPLNDTRLHTSSVWLNVMTDTLFTAVLHSIEVIPYLRQSIEWATKIDVVQ